MKKTVSVSIAATPFLIEEDAYRKLDAYLSEVKAHFAGANEEAEIVADIETRVAEQFLEAGEKIISFKTVEKMIASMGDVRDFGEGGNKEAAATAAPPEEKPRERTKRLYRDPEHKMIAGVAAGLAAYFGVNAALVRFVFVLLALMNGFGIPLYIILWIVLPEARTASQRLEMTGKPVTLENLADRVKERVEEMKKDESLVQRIVSVPFLIMNGMFSFLTKNVFPILGKILGLCITIGSVCGLFALSIGFGLVVTRDGGSSMNLPIFQMYPPAAAGIALMVYLIAAIPLFLLLFLGAGLLRGKSVIGRAVTGTLLGIWLLMLAAGSAFAFSMRAELADSIASHSPRQETNHEFHVSPFTAIQARNGVRVLYTQSATTSVLVSGRAEDVVDLSVTVENGTLTIAETDPARRGRFCFLFCDFNAPIVFVNSPKISRFTAEHGSRIETRSVLSGDTIEIILSDSSYGTFMVNAEEVSANIQHASRLELFGTTTTVKVEALNGSRLEAEGLGARDAFITANDGSRARIGETRQLEAHADNGSGITYAATHLLIQNAQNGSDIEPSTAP